MTLDELKSTIEQKTGIPASLLQGTEPNEVIAYAKNLAGFAKPSAPASPIGDDGQEKSSREIFGDWANQNFFGGRTEQDEGAGAIQALDQIEAELSKPYPAPPDGGEASHNFIKPSLRDQFVEWSRGALAYNPFNH